MKRSSQRTVHNNTFNRCCACVHLSAFQLQFTSQSSLRHEDAKNIFLAKVFCAILNPETKCCQYFCIELLSTKPGVPLKRRKKNKMEENNNNPNTFANHIKIIEHNARALSARIASFVSAEEHHSNSLCSR